MNQRVGPSLVLSFLIVCFFAVVLFEPDSPRSVRGRPPSGASEAIARREPVPQSRPDQAPSSRVEATDLRDTSSTRSAISSRLPVGSSAGSGAGATSLVRDAKQDGSKLDRNESSVERTADSPGTSFKRVASRSTRPLTGPTKAPAAARTAVRSGAAREPRSAFTVVEADETIGDVALRVYGTLDESDSLWRANRDALPRKDSPLAQGMLLRTPRIR